jgi:hypothetical protein
MAKLMGIISFKANTNTEQHSADFEEEKEEVCLCSRSVPSWYVLG